MKHDRHLRTNECDEHGCKNCIYNNLSRFKSPCYYCKRWYQDKSYSIAKAKYCYWNNGE